MGVAIEHAQDVPLVGGARSILLSSHWAESLFVFNLLFQFYQVVFLFCFGCVFFSKVESFVWACVSTFLAFHLVLKKTSYKKVNFILIYQHFCEFTVLIIEILLPSFNTLLSLKACFILYYLQFCEFTASFFKFLLPSYEHIAIVFLIYFL